MLCLVNIKVEDWRSFGGQIMRTLDELYDHKYKLKFKMNGPIAEKVYAIVPSDKSILIVFLLTYSKSVLSVKNIDGEL